MPARRPLALLVALAIVGASCSPLEPTPDASPTASPPTPSPICTPIDVAAAPPEAWWNDRVFYQVFVRSFADSDADGTGDLRGLIDRLDYLNDGDPATETDLGVSGLWLMPVFEAESYHGYDTLDYRSVERDYGTSEDLRALVGAARERGIAVVLDFVPNHTSDRHPWFLEASEPGSARRDWYVWSAANPGWPPVTGGPPWHRLGERWYYGAFWSGMPDLNLRSDAVTAELTDTAIAWIREAGVDGYRIDAAKHLIEDGPYEQVNTPATIEWLAAFRDALRSANPGVVTIGEVWDLPSVTASYVRAGAMDLAFEFGLAAGMLGAARLEDVAPLAGVAAEVAAIYPPGQFATFLTNHDQNRTASMLGGDRGALRVAASLLLTGPGVPFVYYGEEIGLPGRKPDPRLRVPMPWDASSPAGGFSVVEPWQPLADDWPMTTVDDQLDDPESLLSHYRRLVRLRAAEPALARGEALAVRSTDSAVWASLRSTGAESLLVLVNLGSTPVTDARLSLERGPLCGVTRASVVFGTGTVKPPTITPEGGFLDYLPLAELEPRSTTVIRLER
jgi:glycosidase